MNEGARVVVGVDGSLSSLAAVRRAVVEARRRDALLVPVITWTPGDGDGTRPLSELEHSARGRLESVVELAFDGFPQGVRILPRVLRSEPGRALVATADRPQDLLVVGTGRHGNGRPQGVLHGSVARYCWSNATCEVLIVPPNELLELPEEEASVVAGPRAPQEAVLAPGVHCHAELEYLD